MIKNIIAIYPGRFQPFGKHHFETFKWLQTKFGKSNTYIATSNVTDTKKSPLTFADKKDIIRHYKLSDRLVQVKNPYKSEEILQQYNPKTTAVVFLVGSKDQLENPRFKISESSFFQDYESNKNNLKGYDTHGYLLTAPHVSINIPGYGEMSGTNIRKALSDKKVSGAKKIQIFKDIFGWYDEKTAKMIYSRLNLTNESKLFSSNWWNESLQLTEDPCWSGYKQIGMKKKGKKLVPNCVPESVNEVELKKNIWKDFNLTSLSPDDLKIVWDMYVASYSKEGLDFSADDYSELQRKYKAVYLQDVDSDSIADAFVIYKETPFGNRISLLGTNGKPDAKKAVVKQLIKLVNTKGWFLEASKKVEEIMLKTNAPVIYNKQIAREIAGSKNIKFLDDGYYERSLSKSPTRIVKRLYGIPKNVPVSEGYMSGEQLNRHNEKIEKLRTFLNSNAGKEFVYDFNSFPKTVYGVKMPTQMTKALREAMYKSETSDFRELLMCGGAGGHMAHPFDIPTVRTGKDLIKVFQQSVDYLKKGPASVKIDGVNASIRFVELDGKKQFVLDRGSNKPLDVKGITKNDLTDRFGEGHGMISIGGKVLDIFNAAIPKISSDLKKLGLWDDPNILFNIEYVAGSTNVLSYNKNFLAIHGLLKIEQVTPTKRATKEISYNEQALQSLLNNLGPVAKKFGYEVLGSIPTEVTGEPNLSGELNKKYTVNYGDKKETKTLSAWLNTCIVPRESIKTVDGKTISALSKEVLLKISSGTPLNKFVLNKSDYTAAVNGYVTYLATMKLGDAVLAKLSSPLGNVSEHEGIVIRDNKIYDKPFKITGSFIVKGLESQFKK